MVLFSCCLSLELCCPTSYKQLLHRSRQLHHSPQLTGFCTMLVCLLSPLPSTAQMPAVRAQVLSSRSQQHTHEQHIRVIGGKGVYLIPQLMWLKLCDRAQVTGSGSVDGPFFLSPFSRDVLSYILQAISSSQTLLHIHCSQRQLHHPQLLGLCNMLVARQAHYHPPHKCQPLRAQVLSSHSQWYTYGRHIRGDWRGRSMTKQFVQLEVGWQEAVGKIGAHSCRHQEGRCQLHCTPDARPSDYCRGVAWFQVMQSRLVLVLSLMVDLGMQSQF